MLIINSEIHNHNLRTSEKYLIPKMKNHFGEATFVYFFSKFANLIYPDSILLNPTKFDLKCKEKLDINLRIFIEKFDQFNNEFYVSKLNTFI